MGESRRSNTEGTRRSWLRLGSCLAEEGSEVVAEALEVGRRVVEVGGDAEGAEAGGGADAVLREIIARALGLRRDPEAAAEEPRRRRGRERDARRGAEASLRGRRERVEARGDRADAEAEDDVERGVDLC